MTNQTVCVIGGGSGIGLAVAAGALALGATVWIGSRSQERLLAAQTVHPDLRLQPVDVTDEANVQAFFAAVGALHHLVVSVSASAPGTVLDTDEETVRRAFETKFWGQFRAARAAAPLLAPEGSITLVSAISSRRPLRGLTNLSAANAAVEGLVRALALELAPRRVNAIAPGFVDTPFWEHRLDGEPERQCSAPRRRPCHWGGSGRRTIALAGSCI